MKKVLILESYPIGRRGLIILLAQQLEFEVMEAASVRDLNFDDTSKEPDLVILSINNQLDTVNLPFILARQTPIIIYYCETEYKNILKFTGGNIVGWINKRSPVEDLLHCMFLAVQRKKFMCSLTLNCITNEIANNIKKRKTSDKLADREKQIANLLATGMKTSEIAVFLTLTPSTVSIVKGKIFQK
ncbi:LuxR C-terminal-related transcriptional regulator [Dyadobacter diqingensis]|uniref:LuxR C-terminal-related transcriptional regulator n=1 Tax=Dyadobacter diqingensis TaxID=2938121 RepID=UPI0020C3BC6E|nr:LuxR C-terminal-related transcriptional regulator [Dyadobacter diqingensis]